MREVHFLFLDEKFPSRSLFRKMISTQLDQQCLWERASRCNAEKANFKVFAKSMLGGVVSQTGRKHLGKWTFCPSFDGPDEAFILSYFNFIRVG